MKLLWLSHRDPLHPKAGGAERSISEICSRLANLGHDITVLSVGWNGCKDNDLFRGFRIKRFGKSLSLHFYVPLFIGKNRPDIIINDLGHAIPWLSSFLMKGKSIVFFRHLHARSLPGQVNPVLAYLITAVERCYFIIYANRTFITESTTSVDDLIRLGIKKHDIMRIPPGVSLDFYRKTKKTDMPSIVYFGGMRKYKRPDEVIFIFRELVKRVPGLKLHMIGSGPELRHLQHLIKSFGLVDSVTFTGRVSEELLVSVVAESWVNFHTSVTEGWGYSILEASASGTPTVAYSVPGVVDSIEDNKNGIKVKNNDREAFICAALSILEDPIPWWDSSPQVAMKYTWDKTVKMWDYILKDIISRQAIS